MLQFDWHVQITPVSRKAQESSLTLPDRFSVSFSGWSRDYLDSNPGMLIVPILSVCFPYCYSHSHSVILTPILSSPPQLSLSLPPSLPPSLSLSLSLSPFSGCYLGIYGALGISQSFFVLFGSFSLAIGGILASKTLHNKMLANILRSPMSFFDTTPLGRILNRFSKDIYLIDEVVPRSIRMFIWTFLSVLSTIIVIVIATPIFAVVIVPLGIFYILVQVRGSVGEGVRELE